MKSTKIIHEKRHTNAKPFMCKECGRSFSNEEKYLEHEQTHEISRKKQISCPFCMKRVKAGRNMKIHLLRHKEKLDAQQAGCLSNILRLRYQREGV